MLIPRCILTALIFGTLCCAPAYPYDCNDALYRRYNPTECAYMTSQSKFSLATTAAVTGGIAALVGGTVALLGLSSSGGSESATETTVTMPTLPAYIMVGSDIDSVHLSSVMNRTEYTQNQNQYNDILLAYSLARGYTGKGSQIAVFDSGKNTHHGANVAYLSGGIIAPDAHITSYQVADKNGIFDSFGKIATTIDTATANNSNIYNFSWSADVFANQVRSRRHLEQLTDAKFISSLTNAADKNDAIFVWAAGNDYNSQSSALSALPLHVPELNGHFVNVVAWDSETGALADFSNACGITMDYCITAPGTNLDSPKTQSALNGTSFATPIVSAAISVIREAFPYMKSNQITSLLFDTATDLGTAGIDSTYGHGMLNLERATRPVGTPLVALANNSTTQLRTAHVSAPIAHKIKSQDIKFAFIDGYGRTFTSRLADNIKIKNRGIGYEHLRTDNTPTVKYGNIELGLKNSDLLTGDGFLQTDANNTISFIGFNGSATYQNAKLYYHATLGTMSATPSPESMITNFSNLYTASLKIGAKYQNWTASIGTPDTIISGNMNLRTLSGRRSDGEFMFTNNTLDLQTRPSVEYNLTYKNLTAGFVDNPYGTDEIYVITRGKFVF